MSEYSTINQRLNLRKNIVFAVGEFVINMALLFFSYRLILLQGGLEAVGVWATLYAWINLIRLGDAGVAGAAARFLALWDIKEESERIRAHGETALLTNVAQFGLLSLIGYAAISPFIGGIVGETHVADAQEILPYMMLGFFLLNVSGTVLGILQGLHLGYRRSQLSVLGTLIQLAAVFALVPIHGLLGLALAQILQHAIIGIVGWLIVRRLMNSSYLPTQFEWPAFQCMVGYSLKAQVVNIANGLIEPVSKMLIGHFGGMATLGIYELAYKTVLLPRNLIGTGITAMVPAMTALFNEDRTELRRLYARAFRLSVLSMGIAAVALIVFAPIPSWFWLGRVDNTYWFYVSLVACGSFLNSIGIPAYTIGMASGHMRHNIIVTIATLVGLFVFGYLLGLSFGGHGAVVATAFSIGLIGISIKVLNEKIIHE